MQADSIVTITLRVSHMVCGWLLAHDTEGKMLNTPRYQGFSSARWSPPESDKPYFKIMSRWLGWLRADSSQSC
jgi:hypothetical protein